jgi:hypothetical protein
MEAGSGGDAGWVQSRVIELKALLPAKALLMQPQVVGFADGIGVVLIRATGGFFTVDPKSSCVRKIGDGLCHYYVVPYMNFCTPGMALLFKMKIFQFITWKMWTMICVLKKNGL